MKAQESSELHNKTGFEGVKAGEGSILLVGQPNVGKSVIFHALTGKYAHVSNFPGTTVEISYGEAKIAGRHYTVFDSPGVVALPPRTEDEMVTRDAILQLRPELILQVADAKDLPRVLQLTLELSEYKVPMILVLNMADEARERGIVIDRKLLSERLGIPVIETVAVTGEGIAELKKSLTLAARLKIEPRYDPEFNQALSETENSEALVGNPFRRALALSLLLKDGSLKAYMENTMGKESACGLCQSAEKKCGTLKKAPEMEGFKAKERVIQPITDEVWSKAKETKGSFASKFGLWCLQPFPGYLIAAGVLYLLYEFVGVFGAQTLVGILEETVFGKYLNPWIAEWTHRLIPIPLAADFFVGEYGLVTMAVTYALALIFPIVTTFFIFFGILEDSGYLPRLAVMLDRFFRLFGLNGKAVLPMVLGLGCGTMATVTTRILGTKKEKILVSLLLTLAVPCSAQLGVIFGMAASFQPMVVILWLIVVMSSLVGVGWLASKVVPGMQPPFLIQLPPLRIPKASNILRKVASRLHWYALEVIPLFLMATAVLFVLDALHWLKVIENAMSPLIVDWLGLPAKSAEAFLIGFLRRDYGAAGLYDMARAGLMDARQALVSMCLVTLFMPCIAHLLVTLKERGAKVTAIVFAFVMSYALLVGGVLNFILLRLNIL